MKQKIALVLGSGGARGITHIGVIKELLNQGYEITSISGTSIGSLIGGIYASGKLDEFEEWLCKLDRLDIFNKVDFTFSKNGIIKADKFIAEINKFIPDQNIEDLPIPFAAIATDYKNKTEKVLTKGSLWEAIRASISIPMVITPAKIENMNFIDGGLLNPVPVNHVSRVPGDLLVAVNLNSHTPIHYSLIPEKHPSYIDQLTKGRLKEFKEKLNQLLPVNSNESIGYLKLMTETTALMLGQIAKLTLELVPPDILIEISRESCGIFDFHKASTLIESGKLITAEAIDNMQKL